jgi:hypothetical protein
MSASRESDSESRQRTTKRRRDVESFCLAAGDGDPSSPGGARGPVPASSGHPAEHRGVPGRGDAAVHLSQGDSEVGDPLDHLREGSDPDPEGCQRLPAHPSRRG